ncbi:phosphonate metabolism protein/1,5-bisphosphokinase (PRPP-forming) PhnN [Shimia aestuarii]|nr:phosphonate metabolism protein/1,5-bisphosphokinase (PRPP-forming) PhnN [Shimia aestuarii]
MGAHVIGVVGPSGVGKDTVMHALATAHPDIRLARRVITRPEEAGGEDFDALSEAGFDLRVAEGGFALWWEAHGLRYGIPQEEVAGEDTILVNLSRTVLGAARARFEHFAVLSLVAAPETLAARLAARGRESREEVAARLARAEFVRPKGADVIEISNDGALEDTVAQALDALYPVRV